MVLVLDVDFRGGGLGLVVVAAASTFRGRPRFLLGFAVVVAVWASSVFVFTVFGCGCDKGEAASAGGKVGSGGGASFRTGFREVFGSLGLRFALKLCWPIGLRFFLFGLGFCTREGSWRSALLCSGSVAGSSPILPVSCVGGAISCEGCSNVSSLKARFILGLFLDPGLRPLLGFPWACSVIGPSVASASVVVFPLTVRLRIGCSFSGFLFLLLDRVLGSLSWVGEWGRICGAISLVGSIEGRIGDCCASWIAGVVTREYVGGSGVRGSTTSSCFAALGFGPLFFGCLVRASGLFPADLALLFECCPIDLRLLRFLTPTASGACESGAVGWESTTCTSGR